MQNIYSFNGFDLFGSGVKGGTGADKDDPTGAGVWTTPIGEELTVSYGSAWNTPADANFTFNNAGVTGLEKHKIGSGADRRNTLVMNAGRVANSAVSASVQTALGRRTPGVAGIPTGIRYSFHLTDFTEQLNPASPVGASGIVQLMLSTNVLTLISRVSSGNTLKWQLPQIAVAQYPDCVKGVPTHFEVELAAFTPPGTGNATLKLNIWVNGDLLVKDFNAWDISQTSIYEYRLKFYVPSSIAATWYNSFGISDVVVCSPIDTNRQPIPPMGPQIVKTAQVTAFAGTGWTATGGSAADVLSDADDNTYVQSPMPRTPMKLDLDLQLPVGAELNGLNTYIRSVRSIAASAPFSVNVTGNRLLDGVALPSTGAVAVGSVARYIRAMSILPNTQEGTDQLTFGDTGKFSINLNFV